MKKNAQRILSVFLAVLMLSAVTAPVYATDDYTSTGNFWQSVARKKWLSGFLGSSLIGWVCDDVCSESSDKKHHGSLKSYDQNPDKSYTAVCDFCSAEFPVYDADLSAAYDNYVETLPASGYNSDGSLLYSPTGVTVPITNWSYDYSDRSYKVTLESGDTATITYGDENITISQITTTEGDTITNNYTIYYLVDGSGSVTPPCDHDWQASDGTLPTCTRPGSASYVCSKCQQTKSEVIPALGHNWQVKQTVTTQYDDTGQLVQQLLTEYYEMKENGGKMTMATNSRRRPRRNSGRSTGRRAMPCPPGHPPRGRTGTSTCSSAAGPGKGGISGRPRPDNIIIQAKNKRKNGGIIT